MYITHGLDSGGKAKAIGATYNALDTNLYINGSAVSSTNRLPVDTELTISGTVIIDNVVIKSGTINQIDNVSSVYIKSGNMAITGSVVVPNYVNTIVSGIPSIIGSVAITNSITSNIYAWDGGNFVPLNCDASNQLKVIGSATVSNFPATYPGSVTIVNDNLNVITSGISPVIGSVAVTNIVPVTATQTTNPWVVLGSAAITNFGGILGSVTVANTNVNVITSGISPMVGSVAVTNIAGVLGSVAITNNLALSQIATQGGVQSYGPVGAALDEQVSLATSGNVYVVPAAAKSAPYMMIMQNTAANRVWFTMTSGTTRYGIELGSKGVMTIDLGSNISGYLFADTNSTTVNVITIKNY